MVNNMFFINIFFIYAILGFCFENILDVFIDHHFNSGILYGPWTFIYGIAILLMMIIEKILKKFNLKKWKEILLFFITITIVMTVMEQIGGVLILNLFHKVYWDYSNMKFNVGPFISLEISLLWGVLATFIYYIIYPKTKKLAEKIPKWLTLILVILFIIDIICTIVH